MLVHPGHPKIEVGEITNYPKISKRFLFCNTAMQLEILRHNLFENQTEIG
jgi:hypothetical protein